MKEFKVVNKIFVRSSNEVFKILKRYTIALIVFILSIIAINLYKGNYQNIINIIIATIITSLISIIFQYFINLNRGKKSITTIFKEDNILASSLIITLFTYQEPIIVVIVASIITEIARLINRHINISSCLYGILFVLIYKQFYLNIDTPLINLTNKNYYGTYQDIVLSYGSIKSYLLGTNGYYLSPILSIIAFIYLFIKKSIKYPPVISYLTTFTISMFIYGLFDGMNLWFVIFQIITGDILFLSIFTLGDYKITPITQEGQTIYGIILAIITIILRFIIPELSVVIPLILGPLILTKQLDKLSYKLKYSHKLYYTLLTSSIAITGLIILIISFIY